MRRGEIFRTDSAVPERGGKPGFYVIVSRDFIARTEVVGTVICAPVYSEILGLPTEVIVGPEEGLPHRSAIRCDFLALMFKHRLTRLIGALGPRATAQLDQAIGVALGLS